MKWRVAILVRMIDVCARREKCSNAVDAAVISSHVQCRVVCAIPDRDHLHAITGEDLLDRLSGVGPRPEGTIEFDQLGKGIIGYLLGFAR
eukprot:6668777-Prymnesium_polylepis.1